VADPKKKGLGKGLAALISGMTDQQALQKLTPESGPEPTQILYLDPQAIQPNPKQSRKGFDGDSLQELADSIRREGIQEPIIVRSGAAGYELVSGERRVRATILAGIGRIPAICRNVADADMLRLGLIENIQREDLNAVELAHAYQDLVDEFGWTQEELAAHVGKKRATVANTLRLLSLPEPVQQALAEGAISMGHARALLALESPHAQVAACRQIVTQGLSVRQAERLAARPQPKSGGKAASKDPNLLALEDELRRCLATRVTLRPTAKNRGKIEIEYYTLDDLDRILELLRGTG
jgi:ParB family chromosome partitioning protein